MTKRASSIVLFVFSAAAAWGQAPAFEVASIKPAAPMEQGKMRIGFGGDAGRIVYTNVSLKDVIATAYRVKPFQVSGPGWLDTERFDITAKIPEGVSRDKVPDMLQKLLIERFRMVVRTENKEQAIYALVQGKNGAKLKPSEDAAPGPMPGQDAPKGVPPRGAMMFNGSGKLQATGVTISAFADMLSRLIDRPVLDMTGLEGRYDLTLEISMEDMVGIKRMAEARGGPMHREGEGGPAPDENPRASVFSAVRQLGLKLEPRKAPVDFIVVESAEKVATEN